MQISSLLLQLTIFVFFHHINSIYDSDESKPFHNFYDEKQHAQKQIRVIGYLPDYRIADFDFNSAKGLTDLIYFAIEPNENGNSGIDQIKPETIVFLKKIQSTFQLRIHLCVGGWNRSNGFSKLASSSDARKKMIDQIITFCTKNNFSGVDIDWEHPETITDRTNHGLLLSEMKTAFSPHKLQLSMAIAGWQELDPKAIRAVDAVHLMAYDTQGKHSTFEFAQSEIDRLVKKGVPAEKIILGLPFYGRDLKKPDQALPYSNIFKKYHPAPDADEAGGFYFNGPETIAKKTKLAIDRKLPGVMIWEIGQDAAGKDRLIEVIRNTVEKNFTQSNR